MPRFKYTGQIEGGVPEVGHVKPGDEIDAVTDTMAAAMRERSDFLELDDDGQPLDPPAQSQVVHQKPVDGDSVPATPSSPNGPLPTPDVQPDQAVPDAAPVDQAPADHEEVQ